MKILFDARVLGDQMHGIARYCLNLLKRLLDQKEGHEYSILINRPQVRAWFNPSIPVRFIATRIKLYSLQEQVLIPFLLRSEKFDLFHSPTYSIPLVFSGKGIITIHDLIHLLFPEHHGLKHRLYYSLLVRRSVSRCVKVFTVSEHSKQDIIRLLQGVDERIDVIPNGLDPQWHPRTMELSFADRYGLGQGFLLFVGNPRPHKNFLRVLEAFEKLIREEAYGGKLVVVGLHPHECPESLRDRVIFFPHCNDQELGLLYGGADLLAAPSLYEGFGLPVLEAMACGCPVLVGNRGALPEIVGEAGVLVNPQEVDSIKEGFRKIIFEPDLRFLLRERGLRRAQHYSWEETAQKVLSTYGSLEKGLLRPNT
jgi:glycosyltransferase involved in cell wall biosynthesis